VQYRHVFRRIAVNGDEIGLQALRDAADLVLHVQNFRVD
jgi:hypothetical protein